MPRRLSLVRVGCAFFVALNVQFAIQGEGAELGCGIEPPERKHARYRKIARFHVDGKGRF